MRTKPNNVASILEEQEIKRLEQNNVGGLYKFKDIKNNTLCAAVYDRVADIMVVLSPLR